MLNTLQILPVAGSNGVADLRKSLDYAQANALSGASLVPGTDPFDPDLVGAIAGF